MYDIFFTSFFLFDFFLATVVGQSASSISISSSLSTCSIKLYLDDKGGDGWNYNYLSAKIGDRELEFRDSDGNTNTKGMLPYGQRACYYLDNITDGDTLTLDYFPAGLWQTENLWSIQNNNPSSPLLYEGVGSNNHTTTNHVIHCCCTPAKVTGLKITADAHKPYYADLSWDVVSDAVSYMLSVQKKNAAFASLGEYNDTSVTLFLSPSTTYRFRVAAVSNYSLGDYSDAIGYTTVAWDVCSLTVLTFDNYNFNQIDEQAAASLLVSVGSGVAAYVDFIQTSNRAIQIPTTEDSLEISALVISDDDNIDDLEFIFQNKKTEFYHSGGQNYTTGNSFTFACSMLSKSPNLQSYRKEDLQSMQIRPFVLNDHVPSITNRSFELEQTRNCYYGLIMNDTAGNGWSGGMSITISLNGNSWATQLSCPVGYSWWIWTFWVTQSTSVGLTWVRGTDPNPNQASYRVRAYDNTNNVFGAVIVQSGPPPASTSFSASCSGSVPCPTNCGSLNRQACQSTFNPPSCGPCNSGFQASDGTTSSNANSQCSATPTCPTNCASLNRQACQNTFNPRTCGPCNSGFQASDGTTNSNANSQCSVPTPTCPTNCATLNRQACQNTFNPRTCGVCLSGYTASDGSTNSNSNTACTLTQTCPTAATCAQRNRNSCASGRSTCGTCLSGFSASDGTTSNNSNSQCNDINECSQSPCDANALCNNIAGSFTCTCNTGWNGNGFTCTQSCGQRIRREWFSLSPQQRDQWSRAVNIIFNRGLYTQYVNYHAQYAPQAHGRAMFAPWHRSFLSWWEDGMRGLGGEFACIVQPYWDWTNPSNAQNIFTNAASGGFRIGLGVKDGNCFGSQHVFPNWVINGQCVQRARMTSPTTLPSAWGLASLMNTQWYSSMRPALEAQHNNLHNWVGGAMAIVPTSVMDPVFWVHHTFVDQAFAVWQMCNGGATMVINPTPNPVDLVWEQGNPTFTQTMPGWNRSPQGVWNLLSVFNVRYARTWLDEAFSGTTSFRCPSNNQQWLAAYHTEEDNLPMISKSHNSSSLTRHLMGKKGGKGKFRGMRSAYRPNKVWLAQQEAIYEVFKNTYLDTQNYNMALDKALLKSCLMQPALTEQQAQLFTPEQIKMMHLDEECAAGYCVEVCWNRTRYLASP